MVSPLATPRYARATAASSSKRSPKIPKPNQHHKNPQHSTNRVRPTPDSSTIRPADPTKPCPLASLPAELRLMIYDYAFPEGLIYLHSSWFIGQQTAARISPSLLRVCRLIRNEAAYDLYTRASFLSQISSLRPEWNAAWHEKLAPSHLTLFNQNRNMILSMDCTPPWPRSRNNRWKLTERFGNIYCIHGKVHQDHFVRFCSLAQCWLMMAQRPFRDIKWTCEFPDMAFLTYWHKRAREETLRLWLFDHMSTIALPCVQKNWVRTRREKEMKTPALQMLDGLDQSFKDSRKDHKPVRRWGLTAKQSLEEAIREASKREEEWNKRVELLRDTIGKW
jgi:hypothetical protein